MKKLIFYMLFLGTVTTLSAQEWTLTSATPLADNQNLLNSIKSHAVQGSSLYITTSTSSGTVVMVYNLTTRVLDTLPGGNDLPITNANCKIGPDSTLWVVGVGLNCDSVIWKSSLVSGTPTTLENLWGPRFRPGAAKYAWVRSVEFLGGEVYFAGRWDSVDAVRAPNLIRWSPLTQLFSVPPQVSLMNVAANPNNSAIAAKFAKLSAPGTIMVSLPFRDDTALVITGPSTGYVQKLTVPAIPGYNQSAPSNPFVYKGNLYFFAFDLDPNTFDVVWSRMLKKNQATGTVETVMQLSNGPWYAESVLDVDTIAGKLVMVMEYGFSKDTLSNQRFYPVMAYDSSSFTVVVDSVSDAGVYQTSFAKISNQFLFGRGVTYANGVVGVGFYQLTYTDTTAPVIALVGADTLTLDKGTPYVELGATAQDAEDGDITSLIVTTGTVDTGLIGTYTITYTVTDAAGNSASVMRTVIVRAPNSITNTYYINQLVVFPDRVTIVPQEPLEIAVVNNAGQVIVSTQCSDITTIPFLDWPKGIYVLVVNQIVAKKIPVYY